MTDIKIRAEVSWLRQVTNGGRAAASVTGSYSTLCRQDQRPLPGEKTWGMPSDCRTKATLPLAPVREGVCLGYLTLPTG